MVSDIIFVILASVLLLTGLVGCIMPILPGVPLAWAGLLVGKFSNFTEISVRTIVICGIAAIVISIIDNIAPIFFTKKAGGSKSGIWGSTIGLTVGFFLGPAGIVAGPFAGAFIGELIHDSSNIKRAFKAAWGSFIGFLCGTGIKIAAASIFILIFVKSIV